MLVRYYAVKDVVVGSYMNVVPMPNDKAAERSLSIAANDPNSFKENKYDIQLWYLFTLDSETGLVSENKPELIGNLVDYINVKGE